MTESYEQRLHRYLDEGWDGTTHRPSRLLVIGECVFATVPGGILGTRAKDCAKNAAEYRAIVINKARELWRAGFYADPFTKNPRKRPC